MEKNRRSPADSLVSDGGLVLPFRLVVEREEEEGAFCLAKNQKKNSLSRSLESCTQISSGILFRLSLQQCVIKEDTSERPK